MKLKVSGNSGIESDEIISVQQIVNRYWPYWPLFLVLLGVSIAIGGFYLLFGTPVYKITATILVKDERRGLDESKVLDALNLFGEKKIVENEIEILHSRDIISNVVNSLFLYVPVYENGFVFSKPAFMTSPVIAELQSYESIKEAGKIPFSFDPFKNIVKTENGSYPLNKWSNSPWGMIRFFKNPRYINNATGARFFFSINDPKKVIEKLMTSLEILPSSKSSSVIYLSINNESPERGEAILNTIIEDYNKASVEGKSQTALNTLQFVEKRLAVVINELDSTESVIQRFRSKKGVVDINQQSEQYLENVSNNNMKLSEINVQLAVLSQIQSYLLSKSNQPGLSPSTFGIKDPLLSEMLEKLYGSEMQYEKLRNTTAENNPILIGIRSEIEKARPAILENVENQVKTLEAAKENLTFTSSRYDSVLKTIPQKERELIEISRQQNIKNNIYSFLLQKREEAALLFNSAVSDSKLIDNAGASSQPIRPSGLIVLPIVFIFPFLALIIGVSARDFLSRTVLFRREIEKYTVLPVIGELVQGDRGFLVQSSGGRNIYSEQFSQLRIRLSSLLSKTNEKRIMVTSFISDEGKSYVAANLALNFARTGKRTVLMESDLFKPKLAAEFKLREGQPGLNDFLGGDERSDSSIRKIIHPSHVDPNLYLITTGNEGNPDRSLFSGEGLKKLVAYLDNMFDIIIIDTAPVLPVADRLLINEIANLTVFVIRQGRTPKANVQMMDEDDRVLLLKKPLIVFNGIKKRGFINSGYGIPYGYGYANVRGYGYFENEKGKRARVKV